MGFKTVGTNASYQGIYFTGISNSIRWINVYDVISIVHKSCYTGRQEELKADIPTVPAISES